MEYDMSDMIERLAKDGIMQAICMVNRFHEEVVGCKNQRVTEMRNVEVLMLHAVVIKVEAEKMLIQYKATGESAYLRGHLISEELSELLEAFASGDEVRVLDALGDLLYVILGTAVTTELPLAAAFIEIHKSNMTKRRQASDPDGARVRVKGEGYQPPDLKRVLDESRIITF